MKQLIKARGYELKGDHSPISGIRENDNSLMILILMDIIMLI